MRALIWVIGLLVVFFTPVGLIVVPVFLLYTLVGNTARTAPAAARDISNAAKVAPAYVRVMLLGIQRHWVAAATSMSAVAVMVLTIVPLPLGMRMFVIGCLWFIISCVFGFMESMRAIGMAASSRSAQAKPASSVSRADTPAPPPIRLMEVPELRTDLEQRTLWLGDLPVPLNLCTTAEKWRRKAGFGAKVTYILPVEDMHARPVQRKVTIRCATLEEENALLSYVAKAVRDDSDRIHSIY